MVFRRREPRPWWRAAAEALWPRGGWARAGQYVRHRLRRLPDSPGKIGRGMAAGVFTAFTPFYGLHFLVALVVARVLRGNLLASLIGTFAMNPLTVVPITAVSLEIGHWMLGDFGPGEGPGGGPPEGLARLFVGAGRDLWHNLLVVFTPERADWSGVILFLDQAFLPYLLGGLAPGALAGLLAYAATVPAARVWQAGRRRALEDKLARLKVRSPEVGPATPQDPP